MFDLVTGKAQHTPRHAAVPVLVSATAHLTVLTVLVVGTVFVVTEELPRLPTMMAFVAAAPEPPPPPPPPPAAAPESQPPPEPVPTAGPSAPIEAPSEIVPERPPLNVGDGGVVGGVPGGVPGGVLTGVVAGGGAGAIPPPPPPRAPIRVGGEVKEPALLHRVPPVYPPLAVAANLEGVVILEALVDEQGQVIDVKVLRSSGLLDKSAMDAVRQWRYSPVLLNGRPEKFLLTVVVTFRLERE